MATQKKSTTKPEAKPKPEEVPEQPVKEYAPVPKETEDAAVHCIKNGFHDKLRNIVKDLADDHPFKKEMLAKAEDMDSKAKAEAKLKTKKAQDSAFSFEDVLVKVDETIDALAEYELSQRNHSKPFRHAVIARRRIEVIRDSFKRNS